MLHVHDLNFVKFNDNKMKFLYNDLDINFLVIIGHDKYHIKATF